MPSFSFNFVTSSSFSDFSGLSIPINSKNVSYRFLPSSPSTSFSVNLTFSLSVNFNRRFFKLIKFGKDFISSSSSLGSISVMSFLANSLASLMLLSDLVSTTSSSSFMRFQRGEDLKLSFTVFKTPRAFPNLILNLLLVCGCWFLAVSFLKSSVKSDNISKKSSLLVPKKSFKFGS